MNKEQIESFVEFLLDKPKWSTLHEKITAWFEQNPLVSTETKVVGLTDKQIEEISTIVAPYDDSNRIRNIITGYLMGQKFAQPAEYAKHTIDNLAAELRKCHKIIKAQQFQPNWDDAPADAEIYQISYVWLDEGGTFVDGNVLNEFKRPTPPAPKVEVGQVWKSSDGIRVEILGLGFANNEETVCIKFFSSQILIIRTLSDFLAKFEQVQP
jgi:hypothetical protein